MTQPGSPGTALGQGPKCHCDKEGRPPLSPRFLISQRGVTARGGREGPTRPGDGVPGASLGSVRGSLPPLQGLPGDRGRQQMKPRDTWRWGTSPRCVYRQAKGSCSLESSQFSEWRQLPVSPGACPPAPCSPAQTAQERHAAGWVASGLPVGESGHREGVRRPPGKEGGSPSPGVPRGSVQKEDKGRRRGRDRLTQLQTGDGGCASRWPPGTEARGRALKGTSPASSADWP